MGKRRRAQQHVPRQPASQLADGDQLISKAQAAALLGVSQRSIGYYAEQRQLTAYRAGIGNVGRRLLFSLAQVQRLADEKHAAAADGEQ
jgi:hypothetical protein